MLSSRPGLRDRGGCTPLERWLQAADGLFLCESLLDAPSWGFLMGIEPRGADPIQEVGKYVAIYRRSDRSLKLIVDTFNNDTPEFKRRQRKHRR